MSTTHPNVLRAFCDVLEVLEAAEVSEQAVQGAIRLHRENPQLYWLLGDLLELVARGSGAQGEDGSEATRPGAS